MFDRLMFHVAMLNFKSEDFLQCNHVGNLQDKTLSLLFTDETSDHLSTYTLPLGQRTNPCCTECVT